jgi:hypothetical protein
MWERRLLGRKREVRFPSARYGSAGALSGFAVWGRGVCCQGFMPSCPAGMGTRIINQSVYTVPTYSAVWRRCCVIPCRRSPLPLSVRVHLSDLYSAARRSWLLFRVLAHALPRLPPLHNHSLARAWRAWAGSDGAPCQLVGAWFELANNALREVTDVDEQICGAAAHPNPTCGRVKVGAECAAPNRAIIQQVKTCQSNPRKEPTPRLCLRVVPSEPTGTGSQGAKEPRQPSSGAGKSQASAERQMR